MKRILTILLLISPFFGWATHFTPCSGTGSCSVTSMSGHSIGDTGLLSGGPYTSGTFTNLTGIVFINNGVVVTFTGTVTIGHDSLCQFLGTGLNGATYGIVISGASTGLSLSATVYGWRQSNIDFTGISNLAISATGAGCVYDQVNQNTKALRFSTIANCLFNACGQVMQNSFGSTTSMQNLIDSVSFLNCTIQNMTGSLNQIGGAGYYRMLFDGLFMSGNLPGATTDLGTIQITGNGTFRNCTMTGGYGYFLRIVLASLDNTPIASYVYCNVKVSSHRYGFVDCRSGLDFGGGTYFGVNGMTGGDLFGYNNTSGNCKDTLSVSPYTAVQWIVSDFTGFQFHAKNNFGFNLTRIQATTLFQINTADVLDTSNNLYWNTAAGNLVDSTVSWMPVASPIVNLNGGGLNFSSTFTTDHAGNAWGSTYGRGAVVRFISQVINAMIFNPPKVLKQGN